MVKSIRIVIGGKEYTLRGDNEKIIQLASSEVNRQLEELETRHYDESSTTLSVLAAMNIAEKFYLSREQHESDYFFVANEMENLADYLEQHI